MFGYGTDEYGRYGTDHDGTRYMVEPYPFPEKGREVWPARAQHRLEIILWWVCLGFLTHTTSPEGAALEEWMNNDESVDQ